MSYELSVIAKLDDTDIKAKCTHWSQRLRQLNNQVKEHERNWGRTIRGTLSAIGMTTMFLRRFVGATASALNPVYTAILDAIMQTVYSLQAISAAYAVGGVTLPFAIVVEGAAIGLAAWGVATAMMGLQEMNSSMRNIQSMVDSLGSTMMSYGRLAGSWGGT